MARRGRNGSFVSQRFLTLAFALVAIALVACEVWAACNCRCCGGGGGVGGRRQSVGGIAINADGVLSNALQDDTDILRQRRLKALAQVPGDVNPPTELRKISLRKLEEAVAEELKAGKAAQTLPIEMKALAGLQQIRYVFVYPEQQDIVIAGFAEGWKVDAKGNTVGITTGRPVMLLDDLGVALRSGRKAAKLGITCSIDPTADGLKKLRDYVGGLREMGDPDSTLSAIEQLLGPQRITINGVPDSSHFARVLVAADYRMKRLGMNFEEAPIANFPSYIDMLPASGRGIQNMTPRWWLVPNYQPLLTDGEGLAWELRGAAVKTMTEDAFITSQGAKPVAGKTSPTAQRWADQMTNRYEELALKEPIFAELRNCMDLAIVAALIAKENLLQKAGHSLTLLTDAAQLPADDLGAPKYIDSKATGLKKGSNWIITASGGIEIRPGKFLDKVEQSPALKPAHDEAVKNAGKRWWWN
jgi:hypothetical protein